MSVSYRWSLYDGVLNDVNASSLVKRYQHPYLIVRKGKEMKRGRMTYRPESFLTILRKERITP